MWKHSLAYDELEVFFQKGKPVIFQSTDNVFDKKMVSSLFPILCHWKNTHIHFAPVSAGSCAGGCKSSTSLIVLKISGNY